MSDIINIQPSEYPYSNFHELNLDWIIETITEMTDLMERIDIYVTADLVAQVTTNTADIEELNDDLTSLSNTVTTLSNTVTGILSRMTTAESDIDDLQSSVTSAESDIDDLQTAVSDAESYISDLQTAVEELENDRYEFLTTTSGVTITIPNSFVGLCVIGNVNSTRNYIGIIACSASGSITITDIKTATGITITTDTNSVTITGNGSAYGNIFAVRGAIS